MGAQASERALLDIRQTETALPAMDEPTAQEIAALKAQIDVTRTDSIISFGAEAQKPLAALTDQILADVRVRDTGEVGDLLNDTVARMRGLDFNLVGQGEKRSFMDRVLNRLSPVVRFLQSFETVDTHLDVMKEKLQRHHDAMTAEVRLADEKYAELLEYYRALGAHVQAGEAVASELDEVTIPAARAAAETSDDLIHSQKVQDLEAVKGTLTAKIQDLRLTRQVVLQMIPNVRAKQAADRTLSEKLLSMAVNGIPLWKMNVAAHLSALRTQDAANVARTVSDFANQQLEATAKATRAAHRSALEEATRGVYDIAAVRKAHEETISVIEDAIAIRAEAETRRVQEVDELERQSTELKAALQKAG